MHTLQTSLYGRLHRLVLPAVLPVALLLALFGSLAAALTIDLIAGELDDSALCGMPLEQTREHLGIPSAIRETEEGLLVEYAHLGLELLHADRDADPVMPVTTVTVYAQADDVIRAYPRHFLGTVAKGARRVAVERLLRASGAETMAADEGELTVMIGDRKLEVRFVDDVIFASTLYCN